eukprot:7308159-Pyramimonas_sp.AAC.1
MQRFVYWAGEPQASSTAGTFGGASFGAPNRCTGWRDRMRVPPLGPSVECLMGPRSDVLGGGTLCKCRHWDL